MLALKAFNQRNEFMTVVFFKRLIRTHARLDVERIRTRRVDNRLE